MEDDLIGMHVRLVVDEPRLVTEVKVELDVDSNSNDFEKNYFYFERESQ